MPVFPKNQNTFLGNTLRDHFERIGDNNPLLWQLRIEKTSKPTLWMEKKRVAASAQTNIFVVDAVQELTATLTEM